jgi:hypothetical protein
MKVSLDRVLAQAKLPWAKNDDGSYRGAPSSKMGRNQLQQKGMPHSHLGGWISSINRLFAASIR